MKLDRVSDYAAVRAAHRHEVPATFNFAGDVVDAWATSHPALPALVWADASGAERRYTYADMSSWSSRVARLLASSGVRRGDRVLVMLPRIPEWQVAMVACMRIGAVPIPCITMLTADDLRYRSQNSAATAVVTTAAEAHKFDTEGPTIRIAVGDQVPAGWTGFDAADALADDPFSVALRSEDPAILYYTSGSTGGPKAVVHTAAAIYLWRVSAEYWLSLDVGDVMWCTADTGWSKAGTSILFGPWSRGATVLFYDGPFEPERRFALLERHRVTCFCAAATELRRLILLDPTGYDLGAMRLTVSAGESVNPEVVERWTSLVGTPLLDGYGQTETLMTVTNMPGMEVRPGSMGRPLPGVEVGVRSPADGSVTAAGSGELVVRAPNRQLMARYHNDEARTAACYAEVDGARWFLTGDNVTIDVDGYVYYTGRADDIIGSAGYRIGPQEVENALIKHPAVQETAVVGAPDHGRGEVVTAFVVLKPGIAPSADLVSALQAHTKATTAPYKYPRRVEFVDELPKTVSGKIQRNVLRERLRGH